VARSWPAWAVETIDVSEPDPAWVPRATALIEDLNRRLDRWLTGPVEHVGSTAVPGLVAKPIVDLMAPVASLDDSAGADGTLVAGGWSLVPPDLDQRPWRRMFVLAQQDRRLAHLHLVESEHPRWRQALAFRDRLRDHPELAAEYAHLKRRAAQVHASDREAYTQAKSALVAAVVSDIG